MEAQVHPQYKRALMDQLLLSVLVALPLRLLGEDDDPIVSPPVQNNRQQITSQHFLTDMLLPPCH